MLTKYMKRLISLKLNIKNLAILAVMLGFSFTETKAQVTGYLGATLGAQYTTIASNMQQFTGGVGFNAALSFEMRFSRNFGIELQSGISTLTASTSYKDS